MDSFELNKMIGAFLAVVFVVFSVSIVSDSIFATHAPETPGYAIEVPEEDAGGGGAAEEEAGPSVIELLASADPEAGEAVFRRCASCHTAEEGGANRVGPNLWGVVTRPVASVEGFSYSSGMRAFAEEAGEWSFEHLSAFLQDPRGYVPGTTMAFAGLGNPEDEADLIAYLRTLSDDPAPLPEVVDDEETDDAGEEADASEEEESGTGDGEEADPAEGEATEGDEDAAAEDDAETEAEPVEPTPEGDGTAAGEEPDAGVTTDEGDVVEDPAPAGSEPAGNGETDDETEDTGAADDDTAEDAEE